MKTMNKRAQDYFIYSVAVILFVTAAAKIFAATGTAHILNYPDRVLALPNRQVFYGLGIFELGCSAFLLMKNGWAMGKLTLIAGLATTFLVYRTGLWWAGAPNLCNCLGNLNDKLSISPRIINAVMVAILIWLLAGSYLLIIWERLSRAPLPVPSLPPAHGVTA